MTISDWLRKATKQLKDVGIESPRLDAELLLAETIRKPRTYLHAHLDQELDPRRVDIAYARLDLRLDRVPLAYVVGYKEFYGRTFSVSPATLIPRPESEDLISVFLEIAANDIAEHKTLIDIGTGSGCLGITIKLERPDVSVILADISPQALAVAQKNADALGAEVRMQEQDLLTGHVEPLDYIVANLPYIDESWQTSPELRHEPRQALFAKNGGLALIFALIEQAPRSLKPNGWILLEADPEQHPAITQHASQYGFRPELARGYCLALRLIGTER